MCASASAIYARRTERVTIGRAMIRRLLFLIFFCLGGFLFYIPKWLFMGTKGSRDRKKIIRQQQEILRRMKH
jgi:hypothetical protein